MRTNDFTGVYHMMEEISPEAYKAQRLQELKDLAEFRQRHLAAIVSWSVEENRLARQKQHYEEDLEARRIANERAQENPDYIRDLMSAKDWRHTGARGPVYSILSDRVTVSAVTKATPKVKGKWWSRFFGRK